MASRFDRIEKEVSKDFFWRKSNRIDLKWGSLSNLHGMFPLGQHPLVHIAVWTLSTTPNEAINREPHRVATGATAATMHTDHSTAYPGGSSSK